VRRAVLIALSCAAAALLAGCGSEGTTSATPETVVGSTPQAAQEPETPAFKLTGDPTAGEAIFKDKGGCSSCHTLAAAGATGTVGPNLDTAKPDYRLATARVTNGKGVMPSFKGQLSDQEIANVAAYVVKSTGGTVP
jgi:mono/diheme cytochrome c family protein